MFRVKKLKIPKYNYSASFPGLKKKKRERNNFFRSFFTWPELASRTKGYWECCHGHGGGCFVLPGAPGRKERSCHTLCLQNEFLPKLRGLLALSENCLLRTPSKLQFPAHWRVTLLGSSFCSHSKQRLASFRAPTFSKACSHGEWRRSYRRRSPFTSRL